MQGYIDNAFHCGNHPNTKRIKSVSWHNVKAGEIYEVIIGPLENIEPNILFLVVPGCPLKPLNRFVYQAANKTITVPLLADRQQFINSDSVLFTLSSTSINTVWNILTGDDIFYSDDDDDVDEVDEVDEDNVDEADGDAGEDQVNEDYVNEADGDAGEDQVDGKNGDEDGVEVMFERKK